MKKLMIVIPALEPDNNLINLIDNLNNSFDNFSIIVVDDGSKDKNIFKIVANKPNTILLSYDKNMGKGYALKHAYKYIKSLNDDFVIITADSDGQHKVLDIKRMYEFYLKNNKSILLLGSRKFDVKVPLKSSFGNDVSRFLLRASNNKHLNDTQTGLRAFSSNMLDFMININGNRYEYEINVLVEAINLNIEIKELLVETIYIDDNKGSHFRPVKDFSRICLSIIKYKIPFFISLLLDFILMIIAFFTIKENLLIISIILSIFAIIFNVVINERSILYGRKKRLRNKKYLLFLNISLLSGILFTYLFNIIMNIILARFISNLLILILISLLNYFVLHRSKFNNYDIND